MSPPAPIRVGVVGAGANTRKRHLPGLLAIDGVSLGCVANRSRDSSEAVARDFGVDRVHEHWSDVVADPEVDAVVIGTYPDTHAPITLAALAHGKHVLCEARLATTLEQAVRMRDAARARPELTTQVVPPPLAMRVDATVQRLLADGYLGDMVAVDARSGGGFAAFDGPFNWRYDADRSGVNMMLLGVLYETVMRWAGEATRLVAMTRTVVRRRRDEAGRVHAVRVPDHADVIAELSGGAQLRLLATEVTGHRAGVEITLFGTEGTIRFADGELAVGRRGEDALAPLPIAPEDEGGWRVEAEFIGAIRGEEEVRLATFDDGVKYMAFTEALVRSAATGRAIDLSPR